MYLAIALSAEGTTDQSFLWPIIYRTALLLASEATIQEHCQFLVRASAGNDARTRSICEHAQDADIFIVHADTSHTALDRIEESIVTPIRQGVEVQCGISAGRVVPLLTMREMEAWALACPDTIAQAFGFRSWPSHVDFISRPGDPERVEDSKAELRQALSALGQRPYGEDLHDALGVIGNMLPLERLSRLSSYRTFRDALGSAILLLSQRGRRR